NTFYYLATMNKSILILTILTLHLLTSCGGERAEEASAVTAFVGATIFDGTGETLIEDGVMLVREGRVVSVGAAGQVDVPDDAEVIDVKGKWIIPGLINAHGHVGDIKGLESGHYSAANI